MINAIPLTVIPLILYNAIGFAITGEPWGETRFSVPLVSGHAWNVTFADLLTLVALACLFFETLRSAKPALTSTVTNHIVSTVVLIIYIVELIVVPIAATSLFVVLTAIALFDVVAGFTISIRTAQRDITFGGGGGQGPQ
jgi:hypothetical protein